MQTNDIVARLRDIDCNRGDLHEAADEIERLRAERDKARRAWCLYLAANAGLQKEQVANMNGWDCFKENTDGT